MKRQIPASVVQVASAIEQDRPCGLRVHADRRSECVGLYLHTPAGGVRAWAEMKNGRPVLIVDAPEDWPMVRLHPDRTNQEQQQ
ncbi:MAG: hypothetical protein AAF108_02825 [Planctomycetota bacterium]